VCESVCLCVCVSLHKYIYIYGPIYMCVCASPPSHTYAYIHTTLTTHKANQSLFVSHTTASAPTSSLPTHASPSLSSSSSLSLSGSSQALINAQGLGLVRPSVWRCVCGAQYYVYKGHHMCVQWAQCVCAFGHTHAHTLHTYI
jgi:hypothetical protein